MTATVSAVVFTRVSLAAPVPFFAALLMPFTAALVQVKVTLLLLLVGVYTKGVPLQIAAGFRVLLSKGLGFTVTVTFTGVGLAQPPSVAVY